MKELHISNHPLIQHKLALMRSVDTEPKKFREVVREITGLLLYEATQDLETLEMAEASYAPANCSKLVRALARRANCRIMGEPFQRGLLAAVLDVLGNDLTPGGACLLKPTGPGSSGDLIRALLRVAERPRYRQFLAALNYRGL